MSAAAEAPAAGTDGSAAKEVDEEAAKAAAKALAKARRVRVNFQPVGSAPMLRKTKFRIDRDEPFAVVVRFLRKMLKLGDDGDLFLYCNHTFCPTPDVIVGDLHQCFQVAGELILNYSITNAWG